MIYVLSIFDGHARRLIGPLNDNEAKRLKRRLEVRAEQLGMDRKDHRKPSPPALTIYRLCDLADIGTLEDELRLVRV